MGTSMPGVVDVGDASENGSPARSDSRRTSDVDAAPPPSAADGSSPCAAHSHSDSSLLPLDSMLSRFGMTCVLVAVPAAGRPPRGLMRFFADAASTASAALDDAAVASRVST
jgi:hypothetical protein